jgi:pimeloyl-ACP methyl ester carboxylesterase
MRTFLFTLLIATMLLTGCATHMNTASGPIVIERQGSFYVGGRQVTGTGSFDPAPAVVSNAGATFWIDSMYVQFQIPPNARKLPLVFVHGGGGTGQVWETTPDGREGFATIFLRRGFAVYLLDAPRGGRSGFPSFNGPIGKLDDAQQVIPATSLRPGLQYAWSRWRFGPQFPQTFAQQAFPMATIDEFMKGVRPVTSDNAEVSSQALVALLDRIGPAIVVTHSNSGLWGWLAAVRSPNAKAVVSYEPNVVWPRGETIPVVVGGVRSAGQASDVRVSPEEFANLAKIPVQVVFGDNIPTQPVSVQPADGRRLQLEDTRVFVDMLTRRGGKASLMLLPEVGLRGNSHFMFQDLNNVQVADHLSSFLARFGLDSR